MIGSASRPRRHDLVLARPGEHALILLNPRSGHYFTLDEIGTRVWELCDGTRSVAEMAATIGNEYEAPVAEIEADVRELLVDLVSEQLVIEAG